MSPRVLARAPSPRATLWLTAAILASACGAPVSYHRFLARVPYHDAPLPSRAKIFLIAGGVDVANFAAEVVAQRALWRERGYADDEIACYWAAPSRAGFRGDRAQFRRLAGELRGCYPASAALVREHLTRAAGGSPPFLYVYVTSHGLTSLLPGHVPKDILPAAEGALLDQPTVQLGAGPGAGVEAEPLILALRAGAAADDLVFAPEGLRRALAAAPAGAPKLVVLQACHAGSFAEALAQVPGAVGLMAARRDRTSFGCDPGREMTMFGAVYLRALAGRLGAERPPRVDWEALFREVEGAIAAAEREQATTPSLPVFVRGPG